MVRFVSIDPGEVYGGNADFGRDSGVFTRAAKTDGLSDRTIVKGFCHI